MVKHTTLAACAMQLAAASAAMPGRRSHDCSGIAVPDMDQAVTFFTDVMGCQKASHSDLSPMTPRQ